MLLQSEDQVTFHVNAVSTFNEVTRVSVLYRHSQDLLTSLKSSEWDLFERINHSRDWINNLPAHHFQGENRTHKLGQKNKKCRKT